MHVVWFTVHIYHLIFELRKTIPWQHYTTVAFGLTFRSELWQSTFYYDFSNSLIVHKFESSTDHWMYTTSNACVCRLNEIQFINIYNLLKTMNIYCLFVKTSLSAKPFIWKLVPTTGSISCKMIFITIVWLLDSFWSRGIRDSEMAYWVQLTGRIAFPRNVAYF